MQNMFSISAKVPERAVDAAGNSREAVVNRAADIFIIKEETIYW
jgi:hypothetical protein